MSLPSVLGRSEAAAFRNQLLVAFEQKESVAVECQQPRALPGLWAQLLHSAAVSANERGLTVTLRAASAECRQSLQAIGFEAGRSALVVE